MLTLTFDKTGYFGAQRTVMAPRQDYGRVDDVALVKPDPVVSVVQLTGGATPQVATSSVVTDADGTRKATVIFDAGTTATLRKPDGTTQPIMSLSVRLTEFTVGTNGREAMPASLPATSAYTYAVEPTADEALAVGGTVTFNKPVSAYVDNFLNFPVGLQVPLGVLDRASSIWVPKPDGRVIKVLSVAGGMASVDANGDGAADPQIVLDSLGLSVTELQQLAATYAPGATVMRTRLFSFGPFDANMPFKVRGSDPVVVAPPGCASATRDIIKCDVRVATQAIDVPGTPYTLAYTSARAAGAADRRLRIPVTGATMPADLMGAYVRVWVAGQMTEQQYLPAANLTYDYQWDGNDAYGRPVQGNPIAVVEIGHLYQVEYQIPASAAASFGLPCAGAAINGQASCVLPYPNSFETERHSFWRVSTATTKLGGMDAKAQGLGGFDFNVRHSYDPVGRVLYLGDGTTRVADAITPTITTVAGNGNGCYPRNGIPATQSCIFYPTGNGVLAMPDGSFLFPNSDEVRRVRPDGIITRFAGNLPNCPPCYGNGEMTGEGGPATNAYVGQATALSLAPDGTVYFGEHQYWRILRVSPNGILTRVVGMGSVMLTDGRPVQGSAVGKVVATAVSPDGTLYFVHHIDPRRVYRIGADSVIRVYAGTGVSGIAGDGGPARLAQLADITAIAFGPDGSLYVAQGDNSFNRRIRRIGTDGVIRLFAGGGGSTNDNGVVPTNYAFSEINALTVGNDGTVYVGMHSFVQAITPDGVLRRYAGSGNPNVIADGGPALRGGFNAVLGVSVAADGSVLLRDYFHHRVRKIAAAMPGFSGGAFLVASADGRVIYSFDASGRHLKTVDKGTKQRLFSFEYDARGFVSGVRDREGDLTSIERDNTGRATAIVAATGQRTAVAFDALGNLARIEGPGAQPQRYSYSANALLTGAVDKNGQTSSTGYDVNGRVTSLGSEDGSFTSVSLVPLPSGQRMEMASAEGRRTGLTVERLPDGSWVSAATLPDGRSAQLTSNPDGTTTSRLPNGTVLTIIPRIEPTAETPTPLYDATVSIPSSAGTRTKSIHTGVAVQTDANGDAVVQTDSTVVNGRLTLVTQNQQARTVTTTTALGRTSSSWLDSLGRVRKDSMPGLAAIEYVYDTAGRITDVVRGAVTQRSSYDAAGRLLSRTTGGRTTRFRHDLSDRVVARVGPNGDSTLVVYDAGGSITGVTPPGRGRHGFSYTPTGMLETYNPPSVSSGATATELTYDRDSKPVRVVRGGIDTLGITYDSTGLVRAVQSTEGRYDFTYYPSGLVKQAAAPSGSTLAYEHAGPFTSRTVWRGPVGGEVAAGYTNDFLLGSQSVAGSSTIAFGYDADLSLRSAGALNIERNASNGLRTATVVGNTRTTIAHDASALLTSLTTTHSSTGASLYSVSLGRDALGRVVTRTETLQGAPTSWAFAYDSASRLAEVKRDGSQVAAYEYDANGNRSRATGTWGVANGTTDAQDRLLGYGGATYGYTPVGELRFKAVGADTTWYRYSSLGALLEVRLPGGITVGYDTDAEGRRIGKRVNGALVKGWLYDGDLAIVAEVGPAKTGENHQVTRRFVFGESSNVPEYMVANGSTYRLIADERGSVRLVVDASTGSVIQRLDYDAFGRVTQNTNPGFQPFGFAGGLYDETTGLVRFGARDYDAETGRWTAKDPIGFRGREGNLYAYASGDPVNWTDATGLAPAGGVAEQEATLSLNGSLSSISVQRQFLHKLVKDKGGCYLVQKMYDEATDFLVEATLGELGNVIYDGVAGGTDPFSGKDYVGKTVNSLSDRLRGHHRQLDKLRRILVDFGGLSIEDAEATLMDDIAQKAGYDNAKEARKAGGIANKIKAAKGTSYLCKK